MAIQWRIPRPGVSVSLASFHAMLSCLMDMCSGFGAGQFLFLAAKFHPVSSSVQAPLSVEGLSGPFSNRLFFLHPFLDTLSILHIAYKRTSCTTQLDNCRLHSQHDNDLSASQRSK
jgi:hypothetical protein